MTRLVRAQTVGVVLWGVMSFAGPQPGFRNIVGSIYEYLGEAARTRSLPSP